MAKRASRRSFIRRKRVTPKQDEKKLVSVAVEEMQEEVGDFGFISGFRTGDVVSTEMDSDFLSDNEVEVSDQTFEEFEKMFGTDQKLMSQSRSVADSLGKVSGMLARL